MNKWFTILGVMAVAVIMVGCSAKDLAKSAVEKAYASVVSIEGVVTTSSSQSFVSTVKMLDLPLKVLNAALGYIKMQVSDPSVVANLDKAINAITEINGMIATLDITKVEETKVKILSTIGTIKNAIVVVGKYVGADVPPKVVVVNVKAGSVENMNNATKELQDLLDKANKK